MPDKPAQVVGTLLTIGDEILLGDIPNGNAHHIARELRAKGFRLQRIVTVGDTENEIVELLSQCLDKSHFIVATGGLGPTDDDRTNSAVSKAFSRPLITNQDYEDWLKKHLSAMGKDVSAELERMAALPKGAVKLGLDMAGFFLLHRNVPCYFLPGVPGEMKYLLGNIVIPDLESRFPERTSFLKHIVRVQGLLEAEVNRRLRDLDHVALGVDIGYLPQGRENWITIFASAPNEEECRSLLRKAEAKITELIGERNISGHNEDCLEQVIGRQLRARGWKLTTAESCTGGLLSRKITSVAGASDYLDRGFVTYSNQAKTELLGVSGELLQAHGAVSEQVALAMAEGALKAARADIAVGITGIAGPEGGSPEKPVGTVYIACVTRDGRTVERFSFGGAREQVQESAAHAALVIMWKMLTGESLPRCD
ncbi:MAG: CinA family nicotinamide mononucleotide deamidase-related protein [Desulfobacteraceae bacterium]|nr:CinA family nicotinamide mononucleotide deamidase-related protein [Desulfobacteraceae bacterium]